MAQFPSSVPTDANLYIAKNNLSTSLNGAIDDAVVTITVVSTTGFPTVGYITIDAEAIKYTGTTATTFTGCTRGADGTANAAHTDTTVVYHNVVADHHNSLKDEVIAIAQNLSDRIGLGSTQVKVPDGTIGAPSLAFATSPNMGAYYVSANRWALVVNGASKIDMANTVTLMRNQVRFSDGSAASPSVSFESDPDTGVFRIGTDQLGFATTGIQRLNIATLAIVSSLPFRGVNGSTAAPTFSFSSDSNTGIFLSTPAGVSISANGGEAFKVAAETTSGATRMWVYDNDNAALERVTVGAADSGGAGFKVLRIPN
jgi:hypothetical protein